MTLCSRTTLLLHLVQYKSSLVLKTAVNEREGVLFVESSSSGLDHVRDLIPNRSFIQHGRNSGSCAPTFRGGRRRSTDGKPDEKTDRVV